MANYRHVSACGGSGMMHCRRWQERMG